MSADLTDAEPLTVTRNLVPNKYRGVAVSTVNEPLDAASLTRHLLGKSAYRRTRFVVARNGEQTAIARVWRDKAEPLFAPITRVQVLATPEECAYVHCPDADTAIPSALAHAAVTQAPGRHAVAVQGLYEHVSFIIDPVPLRVTVHELVPPEPPKLLDQARRILAVRDNLPPIELVPDIVRLADLAGAHTAERYLVPCRGSGFDPPQAQTYYLDEHPPEHPWTMIGCERSQQIHQAFYGYRAPEQLDTCPRHRPPTTGPLLSKCCLLEGRIQVKNGQATVPWGASLAQVERALQALARAWEPTWAPG